MQYFELTPAYGRDYKTSKEVKDAWANGADFGGDYALNFQLVDRESIPKPCTVNLRYAGNRKFTQIKESI